MDKIDKAISEDDIIQLRETLNEITMEKIDIVKKIIDKISPESDDNKTAGKIIFNNEFRILIYIKATNKLLSIENCGAPRLINESRSEIELLTILNELECKTIESFKVIVE